MTGTPFRLAVATVAGQDTVLVEVGGHHVPLLPLLSPDEAARLGRAPRDDLMPLLERWSDWNTTIAAAVERSVDRWSTLAVSADSLHFKSPVARPAKLVCIGANYHDHIEEMKIPMVPSYPYSFFKPASTTLRGSGVAVEKPANVAMMDWEAELAVIIGTRARQVSAARAYDVVAGYANLNDLSARDWIATRPAVGVDWTRHKAHDGFAPMGPYFVPAQFVEDPMDLPIELSVNGVVKQASNTSQMVFGIAAIIEHLSSIMTLEPGDVIATGTPAGCGTGKTPPEFLNSGDTVRMTIGNLGELVTPIR